MSELNETAVSELNNTLQAMVNDGLDGGVNSSILLLPKKIKPAGIGGIVGVQAEPFGDILGDESDHHGPDRHGPVRHVTLRHLS